MAEIRLRFVSKDDLSSPLIRWFGGDLGFSHVGALTDDGRELGARAHKDGARAHGVQYRPIDYAAFDSNVTVVIPCSEPERDAFWQALTSQIGKPYSHRTIIGFILGRVIWDWRAWDCSTLIAWALQRAGLLASELYDKLRRLTPNDDYLIAVTLRDQRSSHARPGG